MFDTGFSEILLVCIIGLIVLGPKRLPLAVKTVVCWVRKIRHIAANVQKEISEELKIEEVKEALNKSKQESINFLEHDLNNSIEAVRNDINSINKSSSSQITSVLKSDSGESDKS